MRRRAGIPRGSKMAPQRRPTKIKIWSTEPATTREEAQKNTLCDINNGSQRGSESPELIP